jgi:hypothetical protein
MKTLRFFLLIGFALTASASAQALTLGNLATGQSVSFELLLSILTGTRVPSGPGRTGSCDGGSSVPGGIDDEFDSVESEGTCFSEFSRAEEDELVVRIAQGEFSAFTFQTPSQPAQLWEVEFSGALTGSVNVSFGYDASLLPPGFDENGLAIHHHVGGAWVKLPGTVDMLAHSIGVSTTTLGAFVLGTDALTTFDLSASPAPLNRGVITGAGTCAQGSSVTRAAAPNAGYVFASWAEDSAVVSKSPTDTFTAAAACALVAHYAPDSCIDLAADPKTAGDVSGEGVFPDGSPITVTATPRHGHVSLDWRENDAAVSTDASYTFTTNTRRLLIARFAALPKLSVAPSAVPGEVLFTWPDVPAWVLQECADLSPGGWANATHPITVLNGQKRRRVPANEGRVFFQLVIL